MYRDFTLHSGQNAQYPDHT